MRDPWDTKKEKQVQRAMEQIPKPICLQITNGCLSPFFCNPMQHEIHGETNMKLATEIHENNGCTKISIKGAKA
jgi:hypothetical protein